MENVEQENVVQEEISEPAEVVSAEPTFKQEDVTKLIAEALEEKGKEWQSSKDKEFAVLQNNNLELETKAKLAALEALEEKERNEFGDTQEVKSFQAKRRGQEEREAELARKGLATETLANQISMTQKIMKAKEMGLNLSKVAENALLRCKTPEEMDGLVNIYKKVIANVKKEKPVQVVDSSVPNANGVDTTKLMGQDAILFALQTKK